jgi:ATP synthase F1 epsilon subunit
MTDTFQLEIVTPEKMVVRDNAESIQIPGLNGQLGVLPGHAPLITELGAGEIAYRANGQSYRFSVAWGFAEVLQDRVTVLAETPERSAPWQTPSIPCSQRRRRMISRTRQRRFEWRKLESKSRRKKTARRSCVRC